MLCFDPVLYNFFPMPCLIGIKLILSFKLETHWMTGFLKKHVGMTSIYELRLFQDIIKTLFVTHKTTRHINYKNNICIKVFKYSIIWLINPEEHKLKKHTLLVRFNNLYFIFKNFCYSNVFSLYFWNLLQCDFLLLIWNFNNKQNTLYFSI